MQCAAVRIHLLLMREPPQMWVSPMCRLTCQGQCPTAASWPPITRPEYTGRPHTRGRGEREMWIWVSSCPIFSLSPNPYSVLGPESSRASIHHPIPVPDPAVLGPNRDHSPDCRSFFLEEELGQDPKTDTPHCQYLIIHQM